MNADRDQFLWRFHNALIEGNRACAVWTATRDFPAPAARSFRQRWKEL